MFIVIVLLQMISLTYDMRETTKSNVEYSRPVRYVQTLQSNEMLTLTVRAVTSVFVLWGVLR